MPELPDLTVYVERIAALAGGDVLRELTIHHPFVLRSLDPPPAEFVARRLAAVGLIGKRIVLGFDDDRLAVIHLMIAGRLHWRRPAQRQVAGRHLLARFTFAGGVLSVTEAGTSRRASLHLLRGRAALAAFERGGLDVLTATPAAFVARMRSENHTLKRALTDPRLLSGIGNAYSDEILHRARLSPLLLTRRASDAQLATLHDAVQTVLRQWTDRLRRETGEEFPEKVTAFRDGMAVHGRFGEPCPDCGSPVQRIRYADNETNYCARCQTGGRLLADRALSRLLRKDWPRSLDEAD